MLFEPLTVYNSSSTHSSNITPPAELEVTCNVTRTILTTDIFVGDAKRHHIWGALKHGKNLFNIGSICNGIPLQLDDSLSFSAKIERHEIESVSMPVTWMVAAEKQTPWHVHDAIVGGLQMSSPAGCTFSFALDLLPSNGGMRQSAVSTTGHCAKRIGDDWKQGPNDDVNQLPLSREIATATEIPIRTPCTGTLGCTILMGDQSYATEYTPQGSTITFKPGLIFKPSAQASDEAARPSPLLQNFAKDDRGALFKIVASRPPNKSEYVEKMGRSTGWTGGRVATPPNESTYCPGQYATYAGSNAYADLTHECVTPASYTSLMGDSGSPVFTRAPTQDSTNRHIEVVLVGVHFGGNTNYSSFVPIDRVYAESLKLGYDWEPVSMKVVPVLDEPQDGTVGANESLVYVNDGTGAYFEASFDEKDFSKASYYTYDARLIRKGQGTASAFTCDDDDNVPTNDCQYEISATSPSVVFNVPSNVVPSQLIDTFAVVVKACVTLQGTEYCGDFGSEGSIKRTVDQIAGLPSFWKQLWQHVRCPQRKVSDRDPWVPGEPGAGLCLLHFHLCLPNSRDRDNP